MFCIKGFQDGVDLRDKPMKTLADKLIICTILIGL